MLQQSSNIEVIDLFCGAGGLSCGINQAGLKVIAGLDFDSYCKYPYEYNIKAPFIHGDIKKATSNEIDQFYSQNNIKVLVGCAPCQTFSTHTHKNRNRMESDKWSLINDYLRIVKDIKPRVLSMENVPGLAKYDIFKKFVQDLEILGYYVSYSIVNCLDYGIPQTRKRLVLFGSLIGNINILPKTHDKPVTLSDTIRYLPQINAGEAHSTDSLHKTARLSDINRKRVKQSIPGGSWKDWSEELLLNCHKKETGKTYTAVYGRLSWDKPSSTITTQFYNIGTGRFIHPEQNRSLSLREGAILQTFPEDYKFFENEVIVSIAGRLIGNAVPVRLGYIIGQTIKQHLESNCVTKIYHE